MVAASVKHRKIVEIPDDPLYPVGSNEWNDEHLITGLENVDNTSDANKPVSTAQAAADAVVAANAAVAIAAEAALARDASNLTGGTIPAARMPFDYETRAVAAAATITAPVVYFRTAGYVSAGDGGGALYKRVVSEPSHAGKIQSADGAWWEISALEINPLMLGAVGDGVTDDTTAMQNAVDTAIALQVPLVIPRRRFRLRSSVTISRGLQIIGQGWEPYLQRNDEGAPGTVNPVGAGSYFYCSDTGFNLFNVTARSGVTFQDVAFDWSHPTPSATAGTAWTPIAYGWAIYTASCEVLKINRVYLRNAVKGIRVDSGAEKVWINDICGQCLGTMIDIDFASDVVRVENVHEWRFYSGNSNVRDYMYANSDVILSGRNDNPFFSNIFGIGDRSLFRFKASTSGSGVTNKGHIQNVDADNGITGLVVDAAASGVTLQISNWTSQGLTATAGTRAMSILGPSARIYATNFRSSYTNSESVYIEGANSYVSLENAEFQDWGYDGVSAAINVNAANAICNLGSAAQFRVGLGNTKRVNLPTSGRFLYRSHALATATKSATQTITTGTATKVAFVAGGVGDDAMYDSVNDRMTPPMPGYYRVTAGVQVNGGVAASFEVLEIDRNGSALIQTNNNMRAGTHSIMAETVVYVNGTDYFEVKYQQNSGADQVIANVPATYFRLERIY